MEASQPGRGAKPSRSESSLLREEATATAREPNRTSDMRMAERVSARSARWKAAGPRGRAPTGALLFRERAATVLGARKLRGETPERRSTLGQRRQAATHDRRRQKKAKAGGETRHGFYGTVPTSSERTGLPVCQEPSPVLSAIAEAGRRRIRLESTEAGAPSGALRDKHGTSSLSVAVLRAPELTRSWS